MEKLDVYRLSGISSETLPFSLGDTTAGSETELQAVVVGKKEDVDLPIMIARSHYFANIVKRRSASELPERVMNDLERYLDENGDGVWENSWVRFPKDKLGQLARQVFQSDLLADKSDPALGNRTDVTNFIFQQDSKKIHPHPDQLSAENRSGRRDRWTAAPERLRKLISLLIVSIALDRRQAELPIIFASARRKKLNRELSPLFTRRPWLRLLRWPTNSSLL